MRQSEPQRIKGWFFLPERPDDRKPGVLTWQPDDGATLELIGGFSPLPEYQKTATGGLYATQIVGNVRPGTIYGESSSGQPVTVWDAQRGSYTAGLIDGIRDEFWHSSWICVGAHIPSAQEPAFTLATVTFDELYYLTDDGRFCAPQWAPIAGVEHPGETQPSGTLLTPYVFPIIGGYRAEYAVADAKHARYSVATTATRPWLSQATEAMPDLKLQMMTTNLRCGQVVKLQASAHVSIRLPDNAFGSAADFANRMAPIDDLVQLATFEACGTEQITLDTIDGTTVSLLMHVGKRARPNDVHEPAAVVFTLADVLLDNT
jgi:ApeA N-terminal domain 1